MNTTGPVHFVHIGGPWLWQHWRAVETARRMQGFGDTETIIWTVDPSVDFGFYPHHVSIQNILLPRWLRQHPIQLANVKDLIAYELLAEHGGIYLDLDTISLRPAWDLLPDDKDLLVSGEYDDGDSHPNPCNTAVMIGRKDSPILLTLYQHAMEMLHNRVSDWGAIGPHLVSRLYESGMHPAIVRAPYRTLNGWSYHNIGDYYANPRDPGEDVRVIHLYSSDHPEWLDDRWMP